ncbi:unnamed protein product [Leuciscus chuanchicus]
MLDDDTLVSVPDISFAFSVWKQFPDQIVGFVPRKHVTTASGVYSYGSFELQDPDKGGGDSYSMILVGAAFFHRRFLELFRDQPGEVHTLVDQTQNCDDIAMNFAVAHHLSQVSGLKRPSGVFVKPVDMRNLEKEASSGRCDQAGPRASTSNKEACDVGANRTSHDGGYSHEAVLYALQECGIRHIDTAKRYGCEEALGKAVADSAVPREELWLTTKLWPGDYGYQSAKQACRDSCARLGVDYLDLYLMHWPDCMVPGLSSREVRAETWRALEELYDEGLCRAIGVSNFLIRHLNELKDRGGIHSWESRTGSVKAAFY